MLARKGSFRTWWTWSIATKRQLRPILNIRNTFRTGFPSTFNFTTAKKVAAKSPYNVVFFCDRHNSLSQRLDLELNKREHKVKVFEVNSSSEMSEIAKNQKADIIFAPVLTQRVPKDVWSNVDVPCIIMHPGIEGDRGRHSIDWALSEEKLQWGVTFLQAAEEMDTGNIWSSTNFEIDRPSVNTLTKSSLYTNEVTEAAVKGILETIELFKANHLPRPLNYNNVDVKGNFNPPMKKADRTVDWTKSGEEIALKIRMSDSSPGAIATLLTKSSENNKETLETFRVFGSHLENQISMANASPEVIGQRNDGILVQCGDGAVWLTHLKKNNLKLPAMSWLKHANVHILEDPTLQLPYGKYPSTYQAIWTWFAEGVCYVHFNFYNGAMNTDQCQRLSEVLRKIARNDKCKVVVLMGGYNYFSNGIHLNCIENAKSPAIESLSNINAMNDVVRGIFSMQNKFTISAFQGNAGAGGVMMALASDLVLAREGVVLNPSYTNMGLCGSEYHTFFLEERLGKEHALQMTSTPRSILSSTAVSIGLIDAVMGKNVAEFQNKVSSEAHKIATTSALEEGLRKKAMTRDMAWYASAELHRHSEIEKMIKNFQSESFQVARKKFVRH